MCIVGEKKMAVSEMEGVGVWGVVIGRTLIKARCMRLCESENINQESM